MTKNALKIQKNCNYIVLAKDPVLWRGIHWCRFVERHTC